MSVPLNPVTGVYVKLPLAFKVTDPVVPVMFRLTAVSPTLLSGVEESGSISFASRPGPALIVIGVLPVSEYASLNAIGVILIEPPTSVVWESSLTFKFTPVASMLPLFVMVTVCCSVSPGSASPSPSTSVSSASTLVAPIVTVNNARVSSDSIPTIDSLTEETLRVANRRDPRRTLVRVVQIRFARPLSHWDTNIAVTSLWS